MRLMYSGRDFAWIYERQDQVSFLDGHVRAFAHFAGVPARADAHSERTDARRDQSGVARADGVHTVLIPAARGRLRLAQGQPREGSERIRNMYDPVGAETLWHAD